MRRLACFAWLVFALLVAAALVVDAQHLIRNRQAYSESLVTLLPIGGVEILPLTAASSSTDVPLPGAASEFVAVPASAVGGAALVHHVSFLFDALLPQIPFACGGAPQLRCRSVLCYMTCHNASYYSVALRCDDPAASASPSSATRSRYRVVAIAQQESFEVLDDAESVTLAVRQRLRAGTKCHFAFANELLGRAGTAGRLRGAVAVTLSRALPFASGIAFHPLQPSEWNNTGSSAGSRSTLPWSAAPAAARRVFVRCRPTGALSVIADPAVTDDSSAASNWTQACCFERSSSGGSGSSAMRDGGDCTVSFSAASVPSFYDSVRRRAVFARADALVNTTSGATDNAAEPLCTAGATGTVDLAASRMLRVNATAATAAAFLTTTAQGRSLMDLVRTVNAASGIGVMLCSPTPDSNAAPFQLCLLHAANASVVAFPLGAAPVVASFAAFVPLCESRTQGVSPVGPFDDASGVMTSAAPGAAAAALAKRPHGPCYDLPHSASLSLPERRNSCAPPCAWSETFGVCLWGDTTLAQSSSVLQRPAACTWPVLNATAPDTRCQTAQSDLPLSMLLAYLCVKRALVDSAVPACVQTAFSTCELSPEVLANRLMTALCSAAAAASSAVSGVPRGVCADPGLVCVPNGTSVGGGGLSGNGASVRAQFVLNVLSNRSTTLSVEGDVHPSPDSAPFVAFSLRLVATGVAFFNLTAIRADLAAEAHQGFEAAVPGGSSNMGRFSVAATLRQLLGPDPRVAIAGLRNELLVVSNDRGNSSGTVVGELADTLVIRISRTAALQPLAGTTQYLDIVPPGAPDSSASVVVTQQQQQQATAAPVVVVAFGSTTTAAPSVATQQVQGTTVYSSSSWMVPGQYTFQRVRIAFEAAPLAEDDAASGCGATGVAAAAILLALLSGLGAWINVAAVQAALVGAQSSCAPDPLRRCVADTLGLVSPARWLWSDGAATIKTASDASFSSASASTMSTTTVATDDDRKAFWTQFLFVVVVFALHLAAVKGYKYVAPLRGSAERTLWWPAPGLYAAGLLAVGSVQTAWVVIFDDELAVLRVLSFFCFAALVGIVLPWWFLLLFRAEENFYRRYDISRALKLVMNESDEAVATAGASAAAPGSNVEKKQDVSADDVELTTTQGRAASPNERRGKKRGRNTQQREDDDQDDDDDGKSKSGKGKARKRAGSMSAQKQRKAEALRMNSAGTLAAATSISLRHREEVAARRKAAQDGWLSANTGDRLAYALFAAIVPSGHWPHTRGMAPCRDLLHPKGCWFSWASLLISGFVGLNFAYVGVDAGLCQANYANMAVLQFFWAATAVYWRPFRVPALNLLWIIARILDFAGAVVATEWVAAAVPDAQGRALHMRRLMMGSIALMLVFSVVTFLVKLRELVGAMARSSGAKMRQRHDERTLDVQLLMHAAQHDEEVLMAAEQRGESRAALLAAAAAASSLLGLSGGASDSGGGGGGGLFSNTDGMLDLRQGARRPPPISHSELSAVDQLAVSPIVPLRAPPVSAHFPLLQQQRGGSADTFATSSAAGSPSPAAQQSSLRARSGTQTRADSVSVADAAAASPSPSASPSRKIVIRWRDDDECADDDGATAARALSPAEVERRSQRAANLLAGFDSLLRVQELTTPEALPPPLRPKPAATDSSSKRAAIKRTKNDKKNSDGDDDEEEEEEESDDDDDMAPPASQRQVVQRNPIRLVATFQDERDAVAALHALHGRELAGARTTCEFLSAEDEARQRRQLLELRRRQEQPQKGLMSRLFEGSDLRGFWIDL